MNQPLVSVIMPAYNRETFIADAANSVLAQDYPALELIVVDDGSTDRTKEILRDYGDRILLLEQQNAGPAVARNRGLDRARGELIAFLDSDDLWLPGKIAAQVRHLQAHPEIGLVYGNWACWEADGEGRFHMPSAEPVRDLDVEEAPRGWIYNDLLLDCVVLTSTVMVRRSVVDTVGRFDPTLLRGQDYDYWLRVSRVARVHKLRAVVALYRQHAGMIASRYPDRNFELEVLERAQRNWGLEGPDGRETAPSVLRRRLARLAFGFGYRHFWNGRPDIALSSFARSVRYHPAQLRSWVYLALGAGKYALKGAWRRRDG